MKSARLNSSSSSALSTPSSTARSGDRNGSEATTFILRPGARLVGQGRVKRDEIRPAQQLVELGLVDSQLDGPLGRQERIGGDDLHLEAGRASGRSGACEA